MNYEKLQYSLRKNFQEFSEFIVYNFGITNYYDLVDFIIDLYNFRLMVREEDNKLYNKIIKKLEKEDDKNEN